MTFLDPLSKMGERPIYDFCSRRLQNARGRPLVSGESAFSEGRFNFVCLKLLCLFSFPLILTGCDLDPREAPSQNVDVPGSEVHRTVGPKDVDETLLSLCGKGVARIKLYPRGQKSSTMAYLPERAVHRLRPRGKEYDYPLAVSINKNCLRSLQCDSNFDILHIQSSIGNANTNMAATYKAFHYLKEKGDVFGLGHSMYSEALMYSYSMDPGWRESVKKRNDPPFELFTHHAQDKIDGLRMDFLIACDRFSKDPQAKHCAWSYVSRDGLRATGAFDYNDVKDWRGVYDESREFVELVSENGPFRKACKP